MNQLRIAIPRSKWDFARPFRFQKFCSTIGSLFPVIPKGFILAYLRFWIKKKWHDLKVLIVKTSALGDIIHSYPVVSYFKEKFPDCTIHWVVEQRCQELVNSHPLVDRTLVIDSKKGLLKLAREVRSWESTYDLLIDLQGNCKSGLITFFAKAKRKVGFGWRAVAEWPNLLVTHERWVPPSGGNIRDDYLFLVQSHFGDGERYEAKPVELTTDQPSLELRGATLLVCPGANWVNKRLRVEDLRRVLSDHQDQEILLSWGCEGERQAAEALGVGRVLPKMSLPELQQLMGRVDLVIAMDSLPLHLCGTTSTPSIAYFGPSSARKYNPPGKGRVAYQGSCPYGRNFEKRCPVLRTCPTGDCMQLKHAAEVDVTFD